jgi:glycosyltransferase involved in cell wall biosynthesis
MSVPVTVIVLTFNEERNLAACLAGVTAWAARTFVVDSFSTDRTVAIAEASHAVVVTHAFETHAKQWAWALATLPIETEWVLGLDADQQVTPELAREIATAVAAAGPAGPNGIFVNRRQVFRGRWIRHGGYYPKFLLKLFRRSRVRIAEDELVDHHFAVDGPTAVLRQDLIEDNRNEAEIAAWTAKHNRYAVLQARQEFARRDATPVGFTALWGSPDDRTRLAKQIWGRMPLFVRPVLYVGYRYVIRLGFLDGKAGFVFHVLQGFWYRLLVDINLDELRSSSAVNSPNPESSGSVEAVRPARSGGES